mmetsp:Transcript_14805/g.14912  ORF Transcript_14805/g.14912 Transcript_14805/m.14912 type:complete len:323 (-) Transcript_14805:296-1264(-)
MMLPSTTVPFPISKANFLNSKDYVAVAGNMSNSTSELRVLEFVGDPEALGKSLDVCCRETVSYSLKGSFSCMELCGIPRLSKVLFALSTYSRKGIGSISLLDFYDTSSSLSISEKGLQEKSSIPYLYTSLSYHPYSEYLAAATETGTILIKDIHTYTDLTFFRADSCGVKMCTFLPSNELLVLGRSAASQIQIWDTRKGAVTRMIATSLLADSLSGRHHGGEISTVCPVNNDMIVCGSSSGDVLQIDLRTSRVVSAVKLHDAEITSLMPHPMKQDVYLATSTNGQALCVSMENERERERERKDVRDGGDFNSTSSLFRNVCV